MVLKLTFKVKNFDVSGTRFELYLKLLSWYFNFGWFEWFWSIFKHFWVHVYYI
jgi:hypothetical protein